MAKKLECIGGPLCGQRHAVRRGCRTLKGICRATGEKHYYRLVRALRTRGKQEIPEVARFWHYIGTTYRKHITPKLVPGESRFR